VTTCEVDFRRELAETWLRRAQISRGEIFGPKDPLLPTVEVADAETAAPGMVGSCYQPGGPVLLSVYPAGGKNDYTASPEDRLMYESFRQLARSADAELMSAFERVNRRFSREMPGWNFYRHVGPIPESIGRGLDQIAYAYVVPFRIRGDEVARISCQAVERGGSSLEPQLWALRPGYIVAMGRGAELCARRFADGSSTPISVCYYPLKRDAHAERAASLSEMRSWAQTHS
jgi:hypothetical protein